METGSRWGSDWLCCRVAGLGEWHAIPRELTDEQAQTKPKTVKLACGRVVKVNDALLASMKTRYSTHDMCTTCADLVLGISRERPKPSRHV